MTKYLVIVLVIVLVLGAVYFVFSNRMNFTLFNQVNQAEIPTPIVAQTVVEVVSKPKALTPTPTTDPETDITALDKDLADLDKSNADLTSDINSL